MAPLCLRESALPAEPGDVTEQRGSSLNHRSPPRETQFPRSAEGVVAGLESFSGFGRRTSVEVHAGIPYFINEFWTAGQRQSHSLHEVSYRACFKAELPEFFIERLTRPNDAVFDPFMGRGTTPVQASLMHRRPYGSDVNPLSVLLARPRLCPVPMPAVSTALASVDWTSGEIERKELLAFYHPNTLRQLEALRHWVRDRAPLDSDAVDPVADWIRMVAINRLSGHSPGFFSGRSMPPNQAVSVKSQIRINEKVGVSPPERHVAELILRKTKSLLRGGCTSAEIRPSLHSCPAWDVPGIADGAIDLIVTSPPFLDVVQYAADNWLRCWFAGIDPDSVAIDMHRGEDAWMQMVRRVLTEQARILRSGGYIAFEVGEVRKGSVLLEKLVWRAAEPLPFDRLGVMVNDQRFTKTANCWGITNGAKGTNTNRIVLLKRR